MAGAAKTDKKTISNIKIAALLSIIIFVFSYWHFFDNALISATITIPSFIIIFIVLDRIHTKKKNGKMLSSITIIIQFIAAFAIGAIALSLTDMVASAISPPNCSFIPLNYLGSLTLLCVPLLFVGIASYILHKISGYDYSFILVSFFCFSADQFLAIRNYRVVPFRSSAIVMPHLGICAKVQCLTIIHFL